MAEIDARSTGSVDPQNPRALQIERSTGSVDPENPRALTDPAVDRDSEPVGRLGQKTVNSKCPKKI